MDSVVLIRALAATTSRTEKERLLTDAFMAGNRQFFIGARLAYDVMITFGVKKVAEITEDDGDPGSFTFEDFHVLADRLQRRDLTGHAARDAIIAAAERCNAATWNEFYRRILLQDLNCGVETSTINKVLEKIGSPEAQALLIPEFSCQLAHDGAKPEHAKKIKGKRMLDVKLDGVRLLTVLDKEMGTVVQYTRNGKVNENFSTIRDSLARLLPTLPASIVLDGEVIGKTFQDLMTQVNRKDDVDTGSAKLAVFDIIPLADFRKGVYSVPQESRHAVLTQMAGVLRETCGDSVYVIPKLVVDLDTEDGQRVFAEFNRQTVDAGLEGIMVKDPAAPYECKRSSAWLKIKPFVEVSLTVVALNEGEPDSKYRGALGALVCKGEDDGRQIEVNVGSGFSDAQRQAFWADRDKLVGMIAEVRADALTKERGQDVWSLRFPRFKAFRGSVPGEKL